MRPKTLFYDEDYLKIVKLIIRFYFLNLSLI